MQEDTLSVEFLVQQIQHLGLLGAPGRALLQTTVFKMAYDYSRTLCA
jgi:hypothetical protein